MIKVCRVDNVDLFKAHFKNEFIFTEKITPFITYKLRLRENEISTAGAYMYYKNDYILKRKLIQYPNTTTDKFTVIDKHFKNNLENTIKNSLIAQISTDKLFNKYFKPKFINWIKVVLATDYGDTRPIVPRDALPPQSLPQSLLPYDEGDIISKMLEIIVPSENNHSTYITESTENHINYLQSKEFVFLERLQNACDDEIEKRYNNKVKELEGTSGMVKLYDPDLKVFYVDYVDYVE